MFCGLLSKDSGSSLDSGYFILLHFNVALKYVKKNKYFRGFTFILHDNIREQSDHFYIYPMIVQPFLGIVVV